MTIARKTLHLRFVENMEVDPATKCWNWTGYVLPEGYGQFYVSVADGWVRAHRKSYELFHGKIPDGGHVLHRCNNKRCVNPMHLYVGADKKKKTVLIESWQALSAAKFFQRIAGTSPYQLFQPKNWPQSMGSLTSMFVLSNAATKKQRARNEPLRHPRRTTNRL